jgi:hypothetical protein
LAGQRLTNGINSVLRYLLSVQIRPRAAFLKAVER